MTSAASFDEYLKSNVLDLSNLEANRKHVKKPNQEMNTFTTFNGSKLWLDLELDRAYYLVDVTNQTCLDICMKNNFFDNMHKITDDKYREESARCQVNCMTKVNAGSEILMRTVVNHPRTKKNLDEMIQIQKEVKTFNEEALKLNNNLSV